MSEFKTGKKKPKHPGWKARKQAERHAEAQARQAERDARSPEQQIALLDNMLGVGVGAAKERTRLAQTIADRKAA